MKKFFLLLAVLTMSYMASASYLYWQLDTGETGDSYNSAQISYKDPNDSSNTGTLAIYSYAWDEEKDEYVFTAMNPNEVQAGEVYAIDESLINSGYTYYVELRDAENNLLNTPGENSGVSGTDLVTLAKTSQVTGDLSDLTPADVAAWHSSSGTMSAAPEPTSGLLLLFGAAMLGLKRKNRSRA